MVQKMSEIWNNTVLIFRGKKRVTDRERFRLLAVFMGSTHLILTGIGLLLPCLPLFFISGFAAAAEFLMLHAGNEKESYFPGISLIYFLTCIHALASCVFLGWTFGFSLYNLVIIPVLFYMIYMTKGISDPRRYAMIYTAANCVGTLFLRRYVYLGKPRYSYGTETAFWVSFFNNTVCFLFVMTFSMLFILELTANREELNQQNRELKRLASYDELTRLRNRRSMLDCWKDITRSDYCVVMGDIDDFKKINDTYGHETGDEVLKLVSFSMKEAVDREDFVSRWGGEEFLMIVFGSVAYALKVIDKVQRELKQADLSVDGKQISVTMTFGISECGEVPGKDVDELIRRADRRLYIGKKSGKNCIKIKDE